MSHQNVHSMRATQQNAVVGQQPGNDQAREQEVTARPEPRAYAAPDVADATLAAPASGEVSDYMDEGDPSFGAHQGASNTNREMHAHNDLQGPKTRKANRDAFKKGGA